MLKPRTGIDNRQLRTDVLRMCGAKPSEVNELLHYNRNAFRQADLSCPARFPLPDELFVGVWRQYAAEAERIGVFDALKKRLVQLKFPVQEGISGSEDYRMATRSIKKTEVKETGSGLTLRCPETLQLTIHPTPAGHIPVITTDAREDFVTLLQALTKKNEPVPIPGSMGASMVSGYNNWDRVHKLKKAWLEENPDEHTEEHWPAAFQAVISQKERYQDRFILMSSGPYSAVQADELEFTEEVWQNLSCMIRMEHESTHYFTRRVFSSMRNTLYDELLADYMGIVAAGGRFRADWFLRFMGLEEFPVYRNGGRFQNYRGTPPLSDGAFLVLQVLVREAAMNLECFDRNHFDAERSVNEKATMLMALAQLTLEEVASEEAEERLAEAVQKTEALTP